MDRKIDLTGLIFGKLTIIKSAGKDKYGAATWSCVCSCGNEIITRGGSLRSGKTISCGCARKEKANSKASEIVGLRFGKLVVEKFIGSLNHHGICACKCDCGNSIEIRTDYLRYSKKTHCGCVRKGLPDGVSQQNRILYSYKDWAKKRNLCFELTKQQFFDLVKQNCYYCDSSPIDKKWHNRDSGSFKSNGIDRLNNDIGYVLENCVPCCRQCNTAKSSLDVDKFIEWIHRTSKFIYAKNIDIPDWTNYFLGIAFVVSQRSKDSQTKHGCLITDRNNHIVGTGYNSFPSKMADSELPTMRPDKYSWMVHAETNCISNCIVSPWTIQGGGIAYITGQPCNNCTHLLWQNNVKEFYIAKRKGTQLETIDTKQEFDIFVRHTGLKIHYVDCDLAWANSVF